MKSKLKAAFEQYKKEFPSLAESLESIGIEDLILSHLYGDQEQIKKANSEILETNEEKRSIMQNAAKYFANDIKIYANVLEARGEVRSPIPKLQRNPFNIIYDAIDEKIQETFMAIADLKISPETRRKAIDYYQEKCLDTLSFIGTHLEYGEDIAPITLPIIQPLEGILKMHPHLAIRNVEYLRN